MAKLVLALVVFIAGMVASRLLAAMAARPNQRLERPLTIASRAALGLGIVIPLLVIAFSTFRVIPAGHVGVATLFGRVEPQPLPEGLNFINPLKDVTLMSTQVQRRS